MSFYVQGPKKGKAAFITDTMEGVPIPDSEVEQWINNPDQAVVLVIDNGHFEAAVFIYCLGEHQQTLREVEAGDDRPRQHLRANRQQVEQAAGDYLKHKTTRRET